MKLSPAYPNCWAKSKDSNRLPNDCWGPSVISSGTYGRLDELMRFRHFKRYYFQLEYDWDRLEYLIALVRRAAPGIIREFDTFRVYV